MKAPKWPTRYWHQTMRGWLNAEGFDRCSRCKVWRAGVKHSNCAECNRDIARKHYWLSNGKAKQSAWKKEHKEQVLAAQRKWYRKITSTPEGRDRLREQWRNGYHHRKMEDNAEKKD